jgi:hypothetical protein
MSAGQKVPFGQSLNRFSQSKIDDNQQALGQALPCSVVSVAGAIVTVSFEIAQTSNFTIPNVTMPIQESRYVRLPVQAGDKGLAIPADTRLGGIDGLGSGLAPLSNSMNLGSLIFFPIGNKDWNGVNPDAVHIEDPTVSSTIDVAPSGIDASSTGTTSLVGDISASLSSYGITSVSGAVSASLSSDAIVNISAPVVSSSAEGVNSVTGEIVMLGQGSLGNLSDLPNGAGTLYDNTILNGASAIYENPVATNCIDLSTVSTAVQTYILALVPTYITSTDALNINDALTLSATISDSLHSFTNKLSNLGAITSGSVPNLNSIIGMSQSAVYSAGGALGTSTSLINGMTSSLNSASLLNSAKSYVSGIAASLMLPVGAPTPASVISTITGNNTSIATLQITDTTNFNDLQTKIKSTSDFLTSVSSAKLTDAGISSYIAKVIPSGTLTTLRTIP